MSDLAVVVLAAGKGVRMKSDLPKVFHDLAGRPMLAHVLETVKKLSPQQLYIIVGYKKEMIMNYFKDWGVEFVDQKEQLGTGHAVLQAKPYLLSFRGTVLILAGDVPLLSEATLRKLIDFHEQRQAAVTDLTAELPDAGSYGRIVRSPGGEILKIVEKKDASLLELKIREINTGTFCFDKEALFSALAEVEPENAQKEYYLTDTLEILRKRGLPVYAFKADDYTETLGINTKEQLAEMEKILACRTSNF